ncbi:MAG: GDP-mannose 4,6-dehydratase [Candidatus Marinimicrobia bacterium]|nr:GDP-mannose 4,6-dehydratase [Candidatus Neomarinimicrobiota bacterium]
MKKILITGSNSFTASHFIQYLKRIQNIELVGMDKNISKNIKEYQVDLLNYGKVYDVISKEKPNYIIHLVGLNKDKNPINFYKSNLFTTINLLESIYQNRLLDTKILLISSSAVYGIPGNKVVNENDIPRPINYYGNSKLSMEEIAFQYIRNFNLKINIARPFNAIGNNQPESFVISSFIKKLLDIKINKKSPIIKVGNLMVKRDFIDVDDLADAYWKILQLSYFGEIYNIGSGKSIGIDEVLGKIINLMEIDVKIEIDKNIFRNNDIPDLVSDISKIKKIGWKPKVFLDNSLENIISNYLKRGIS